MKKRSSKKIVSDAVRRVGVAMRSQGLGFRELGARAGVDPSAISRWKNGSVEPRLSNLEAVGGVLGLTLDELLARH